jgi:hypothetical protein
MELFHWAQWLGVTPPALLPEQGFLCSARMPFEWSHSASSARANFDSEGNSENFELKVHRAGSVRYDNHFSMISLSQEERERERESP